MGEFMTGTSNIECRTSNPERASSSKNSMFGVQRSVFDVFQIA
jgi:hypothetical protein